MQGTHEEDSAVAALALTRMHGRQVTAVPGAVKPDK